jgi:hypothetical protein
MMENFEKWKTEDEYQAIEKFMDERSKVPNKTLELGAIDLCVDIQNYLNAFWDMMCAMKVPKKTKARKLQ